MASEGKGIEITIAILAAVAVLGLGGLYGYDYYVTKHAKSRMNAITGNLRQIASAGQQYILEEGATSVSYQRLEGDYFYSLPSLVGESYDELVVDKKGGVLRVTTPRGMEVAFTY